MNELLNLIGNSVAANIEIAFPFILVVGGVCLAIDSSKGTRKRLAAQKQQQGGEK